MRVCAGSGAAEYSTPPCTPTATRSARRGRGRRSTGPSGSAGGVPVLARPARGPLPVASKARSATRSSCARTIRGRVRLRRRRAGPERRTSSARAQRVDRVGDRLRPGVARVVVGDAHRVEPGGGEQSGGGRVRFERVRALRGTRCGRRGQRRLEVRDRKIGGRDLRRGRRRGACGFRPGQVRDPAAEHDVAGEEEADRRCGGRGGLAAGLRARGACERGEPDRDHLPDAHDSHSNVHRASSPGIGEGPEAMLLYERGSNAFPGVPPIARIVTPFSPGRDLPLLLRADAGEGARLERPALAVRLQRRRRPRGRRRPPPGRPRRGRAAGSPAHPAGRRATFIAQAVTPSPLPA